MCLHLRVAQIFKIELESLAVVPPHVFRQFQLHHHQVTFTADIRPRNCSSISSVDAGLESPRSENILNLIVCDAVWQMAGCSSGDPIRKESIRWMRGSFCACVRIPETVLLFRWFIPLQSVILFLSNVHRHEVQPSYSSLLGSPSWKFM